MAIYGRFGEKVVIVRLGTIEDVKTLDKRKPDKIDRQAIASRCYVVTELAPDAAPAMKDRAPRLHHIAYLRADGGSLEISKAIAELP